MKEKSGVAFYIEDDKGKYNRLYTHEEVIRNLESERDKYKSLYEKEKEKNIKLEDKIKKVKEYIKSIDEEEFINTEHYVEILNLLL